MKLRIPTRLKIEKKQIVSTLKTLALLAVFTAVFVGVVYISNYLKYKTIYESRNAQCLNFTNYLETEVLPLTTANVTDCSCTFNPVDTGTNTESMCLCSCKLYDENGTLIDEDWNPLFSVA